MNFDKKRKRQNGRENGRIRIVVNEWRRLDAEIGKLIEEGVLPPVNYDIASLDKVVNFGGNLIGG